MAKWDHVEFKLNDMVGLQEDYSLKMLCLIVGFPDEGMLQIRLMEDGSEMSVPIAHVAEYYPRIV